MQIKVTGRRLELTDRIKERANGEIEKLSKFFDNIVSANLVLSQQKHLCDGELTMNVAKSKLISKASSEDIFSTIEKVTDKMAAQLKKHKGKMKDRKQREVAARKAEIELETNTDEVDI